MSKENLVKLMHAAAGDNQLRTKLQNARSYKEVQTVAGESGFELGDLTAELTDEELQMVAGGIDGNPRQPSSIIAVLIGLAKEPQPSFAICPTRRVG